MRLYPEGENCNFSLGNSDLSQICNAAPYLVAMLDRLVCKITLNANLKIRQVSTKKDHDEIQRFRKEFYDQRGGYLSSLGNEMDAFIDGRSFLFAAKLDDRIVGTIRLTKRPFEIEKYLDCNTLQDFMGGEYEGRYLEISRLVIDRDCRVKGLAESIITFSGLYSSLMTNYSNYIAYVKPRLQKRAFDFLFDDDFIPFSIESRGGHIYHLVKGSFGVDLSRIVARNFPEFGGILLPSEGEIHAA